MASQIPDMVIQRRHEAAMELAPFLDIEDRILLLGYVSGLIPVSPEFERLEAEIPPERRCHPHKGPVPYLLDHELHLERRRSHRPSQSKAAA